MPKKHDEAAHPRNPKGSGRSGGQFAKKGGTTAERKAAIKGNAKGTDEQGRTKAQRGERRRAQARDLARGKKAGAKKTAASSRASKAGIASKKRKSQSVKGGPGTVRSSKRKKKGGRTATPK